MQEVGDHNFPFSMPNVIWRTTVEIADRLAPTLQQCG